MRLSRKAFRRIHPVADDDDHPARVARDLEEVAVVVHAALFLSYGPFGENEGIEGQGEEFAVEWLFCQHRSSDPLGLELPDVD